ncbi:MAG: hypothetical protein GTO18_20085 [Anaerolineales bacterium]|nr:hypothetical protein [Anaerolineales bacterium]
MFKRSMTFIILISVFLVGCGLSTTTITGTGDVVTQDKDISGFDGVDVSHGFEVTISQGESYSVSLKVDKRVLDYLYVERDGNTLKIGLTPGGSFNLINVDMEAEVTMPELRRLDCSGGSRVEITGFQSTESFNMDMSGGSNLRGDIDAGDTVFDVSGGSNVSLAGSGGDLNVDSSGGADVDLSDYSVENAYIDASGASTVMVNVSGTLDVSASGAASVLYLGDPSLGTINISGGASIDSR